MVYRALGILVLVVAGALAVLALQIRHFSNVGLDIPSSSTLLIVAPGASLGSLSRQLAERGILDKPIYFRWLARWNGQANRIQAGEYALEPGMTPQELLSLLVSGKVVQHAFTLIEGWTFREVIAALGREEVISRELDGLSDDEIMQRMGYPGQHPEGRLLPDTYFYSRGSSDLELLQRAYRAMERTVDEAWDQKAPGLPLKTAYEALILASIIEKETGLASERPEIAGVFVRRLKKGMRLQTDPTVIYGMGQRYKGNIRKRDLQEDTPYNTYVREGLPPTPIAMPGRESIDAALHPADGRSLYFVGRGDGSHQFSETLAQHNRAVRRYQLGGK